MEDNKYNTYKGVCSCNKNNLNNGLQLDIKLLSLFKLSLITRYKLDSIVLIVLIVFFLKQLPDRWAVICFCVWGRA